MGTSRKEKSMAPQRETTYLMQPAMQPTADVGIQDIKPDPDVGSLDPEAGELSPATESEEAERSSEEAERSSEEAERTSEEDAAVAEALAGLSEIQLDFDQLREHLQILTKRVKHHEPLVRECIEAKYIRTYKMDMSRLRY